MVAVGPRLSAAMESPSSRTLPDPHAHKDSSTLRGRAVRSAAGRSRGRVMGRGGVAQTWACGRAA